MAPTPIRCRSDAVLMCEAGIRIVAHIAEAKGEAAVRVHLFRRCCLGRKARALAQAGWFLVRPRWTLRALSRAPVTFWSSALLFDLWEQWCLCGFRHAVQSDPHGGGGNACRLPMDVSGEMPLLPITTCSARGRVEASFLSYSFSHGYPDRLTAATCATDTIFPRPGQRLGMGVEKLMQLRPVKVRPCVVTGPEESHTLRALCRSSLEDGA